MPYNQIHYVFTNLIKNVYKQMWQAFFLACRRCICYVWKITFQPEAWLAQVPARMAQVSGVNGAGSKRTSEPAPRESGGRPICGAGPRVNGAGSKRTSEPAPLERRGRPICGAGPHPVLEPAPSEPEPAPLMPEPAPSSPEPAPSSPEPAPLMPGPAPPLPP